MTPKQIVTKRWCLANKARRYELNANWAKRHPKQYRLSIKNTHLRKKYGKEAPEHFSKQLKKQKGKCAICKRKMKTPGLDHCHKTKKLRELLCYNCNWALGLLKEDTKIMKAMINYVIKHRGENK